MCNKSYENWEASGPPGVAIELFKAGGDKGLKSLTNIFNICSKGMDVEFVSTNF